jgi:hypothetical protein
MQNGDGAGWRVNSNKPHDAFEAEIRCNADGVSNRKSAIAILRISELSTRHSSIPVLVVAPRLTRSSHYSADEIFSSIP